MIVQPYLNLDGRCEEAIEFYKKAIGAKIEMLMRFKDNPDPQYNPPGSDNKVMHCSFRVGESVLMASDKVCSGKPNFAGFSLSLNAANDAEAERLFAALSEGGKVEMPMCKTFFASRFGMVADKFGVSWMVITQK